MGAFVLLRREKLEHQREEDAAGLLRVRPAVTQKDAEATGQGEAARADPMLHDRTRPGRWSDETWGSGHRLLLHPSSCAGLGLAVLCRVIEARSPTICPYGTASHRPPILMMRAICFANVNNLLARADLPS